VTTAPRVCGASCVPKSSQTAKTGARQRFVNDGSLAYDSLEPLQQFVNLMVHNNCEKAQCARHGKYWLFLVHQPIIPCPSS